MNEYDPIQNLGLGCPNGGDFWICANKPARFIGCCTSNPCETDYGVCPDEDLTPATFDMDVFVPGLCHGFNYGFLDLDYVVNTYKIGDIDNGPPFIYVYVHDVEHSGLYQQQGPPSTEQKGHHPRNRCTIRIFLASFTLSLSVEIVSIGEQVDNQIEDTPKKQLTAGHRHVRYDQA
ncbi:hypothetical protein G7Z17_g2836 [Cylindrodendrum hubeiense]|uniref:Uncharacterized protein n=1 Tax=Cylindrodendrum hubeiense TaxID=595255 RepID=A0A9P5HJ15_9HYPO|nr:hypothetical protein G7Z17_g2836 [Cylindrodendrum hubeiense]